MASELSPFDKGPHSTELKEDALEASKLLSNAGLEEEADAHFNNEVKRATTESQARVDEANNTVVRETNEFQQMAAQLSIDGLPKSEANFLAARIIESGYLNIEDLSGLTKDQVGKMYGVGPRNIQAIEAALKEKNLRFKNL